jgi:hypothetical protein
MLEITMTAAHFHSGHVSSLFDCVGVVVMWLGCLIGLVVGKE